ncbi:STAS domain-containing protein [Trujillonella humicola]|uniref:STAS domain-containing protein n=1 Tax=Trujillonella humicola TaxID=3383699 RepID=UPI003906B555
MSGAEQEGTAVGHAGPAGTDVLDVREERDGEVCRLTLRGELSEAARRPLVRALTDVLLEVPTLRRVELLLGDVTFMNSAGMAVLVQLQKMAAPRGVGIVLVRPRAVVARPLQLSGLWHRFTVTEN